MDDGPGGVAGEHGLPTPEGRLRRWAALAGPAGIAVAVLTVLGATLAAPWFDWTANALSDLGHPARATAPLYNGGLVLSGLLGVAFVGRLWPTATNAAHRVGLALLALAFAALALVGVFPSGHPRHVAVSVAFFAVFTYGLFAVGSGDALAGQPRRAVTTTWLAVAHVTAWALWPLTGLAGVAIPELVGALALAAWVALQYRGLGARSG